MTKIIKKKSKLIQQFLDIIKEIILMQHLIDTNEDITFLLMIVIKVFISAM